MIYNTSNILHHHIIHLTLKYFQISVFYLNECHMYENTNDTIVWFWEKHHTAYC